MIVWRLQAKNLITDDDHVHSHSIAEHSTRNSVVAGTGEIVATPGGQQTLSVVRFLQHTTVIHVGQTVEWSK